MKIRRRSLAHDPPVFFQLTEEEQRIVTECCAMTRSNFEVFAFHTDSLYALGNRALRQFQAPMRPPAQAMGWAACLFPKKLFLPSDDYGRPKMEIESTPIKRYRFSIVVQLQDTQRAFTETLRHALITLRLGELNATSGGLMI